MASELFYWVDLGRRRRRRRRPANPCKRRVFRNKNRKRKSSRVEAIWYLKGIAIKGNSFVLKEHSCCLHSSASFRHPVRRCASISMEKYMTYTLPCLDKYLFQNQSIPVISFYSLMLDSCATRLVDQAFAIWLSRCLFCRIIRLSLYKEKASKKRQSIRSGPIRSDPMRQPGGAQMPIWYVRAPFSDYHSIDEIVQS